MKKITFTTILSFIFLAISSLTAYLTRNIAFNSWQMLIIGIFILIGSAILAIFGRKSSKGDKSPNMFVNVICYILSSVALGFCIRAWYIFRGFNNSLLIMMLVSFLCIWYLWIYYALSKIPLFEKHPLLFMILFIALSIIIYVIVIVKTKTTFVSTFGFYMIIEIAFIFAMLADADNYSEFLRNITLSTYSVFVVAIIIALILLAAEGGDFDFDFSLDFDFPSKKKKNSPEDRLM